MYRLSLVIVLMTNAIASAADNLPEPDKLPVHKEFPDPLVMLDGTRITRTEEWVKRRKPELKKLFQHYMYGTIPAARKVGGEVIREDKNALDGKAILREISLTVATKPAPKVHLLLVIPKDRKGPAPVFVGMNFRGNHALLDDPAIALPTAWMYPGAGVKNNKATDAGRGKEKDTWALDQAIARGYAVCTFYSGDIDPDRKEVRGGVRPVIDKDEKAGTIAAWAWGFHRVVDYLVTVPELDKKKIAAVGHSRLGKTALLAAAFDDRIALAIPHQAGCGGTAPSRGTVGESVKRINTAFPHWFNSEFKKFNDQPERLPFDQNCLAALVAPRPLLFSNASKDTWANPDGQFEVLKAAEPVYRLLKAGGLEKKTKPEMSVLYAGKLGYYIRPGEHSMTREDWKVFLDFADKHFGKPASKSSARERRILPEKATVVIRTTKGDIEVELDRKRAPITSDNFLRYVDAGLYTDGVFHRTVRADNQPDNKIKISVVQAGINPKRSKEEFAPIPLERTKKTGLEHVDGAISMARDGPDTATGDFFLCIGAQPELDQGGKRNPDEQGFAAFGRVVKGMDVVKKIHAAPAKGQTLAPPIRILGIARKKP
jgi:cyclophilin family peptidyl-prolyl cis-trans isomerase